jgi:hypothetical protein
LNQITKLQPNFVSVWDFQAHNLSYNVSAEFDDYRQRYHWVKKGISFLSEGTHYNRDNPALLHQVGWFTGQKLGRADEHVQFREMFRGDEDFHNELNRDVVVDDGVGYGGRPDNWLVGRLWYIRAQKAVDEKGMPLTAAVSTSHRSAQQLLDKASMSEKSKSPLIFHAAAPMSLINYSSDIEEEGILGQTAQRAWMDAGRVWAEYGKRPIPTSWGHNVRLGETPQLTEEIARLCKRLDQLTGDLRDTIRREKIAKLTPEQQKVVDLRKEEVTDEQTGRLYMEARDKTSVTHEEVAKRAPADVRDKAVAVAARLADQEILLTRTGHYRGIVNFEYWQTRCEAEQTKEAVEAREFLYQAKQKQDDAEVEDARQLYEQAWQQWKAVFDKYPSLMDDVTAEDLVTAVKRYHRLLLQLDQALPEDFILRGFLERRHEDIAKYFAKPGTSKPAEKPADTPPPADKAASQSVRPEPEKTPEPPAQPGASEGAAEAKPSEPAQPALPAEASHRGRSQTAGSRCASSPKVCEHTKPLACEV